VRQATIPEIGPEGIATLQKSRVAIIGAGGVGSAVAFYLSRSGIGHIRLIDQDVVLESNLQRLHSVNYEDIYHAKAEVLASRLSQHHSSCTVEPIVETLTRKNSRLLLDGVDLLVDGLDNFRTRYVVNEFSIGRQVPYLFSSSAGQQVHMSLFSPPSTGCLNCTIPNVPDRPEESCESLGVASTTTGIAGSLAASIAVRYLLKLSTDLMGQLLTIDLAGPDFILTKLRRSESCISCGNPVIPKADASEVVSMLCGYQTANVLPSQNMILDLETLSKSIAEDKLLGLSDSVMVFRQSGRVISLFNNGRVLIEGVSNEQEALKVAERVWAETWRKIC
jgi:adenylyltransferase/sulfurtransferase